MNEPLLLIPKELAKDFLKNNPGFGVSEAKHGDYLAELAKICLKHGMKSNKCILRLMRSVIDCTRDFLFSLDKERNTEEIKLGMDLATLTSIFKSGRNIKIQATIPDNLNSEGVMKEKHIALDVETNGLLQQIAFLSFNSFLAHYGLDYQYHFVAKIPNDLKQDTLQDKYGITDSGNFFKEPYSDEALADIIEFETSEMNFDKAQRGRSARTKTEVPRLGRFASKLIKDSGEDLASMNITKQYCLIFDLMVAAGISPTEEELRDRELSNKDKYDIVKTWVQSGEKVFNPSDLIRSVNPYKPY